MDTDVAIVGGGAAGLAAALWLAERSIGVIVLEGSSRTGGRVLWRSVGSSGEPAELGAEFIHGEAPETSELLRRAGLGAVATGNGSWLCASDGAVRPAGDDFGAGDLFDDVRSLSADESVDAFLRRFEGEPERCDRARRARAFVEGFEAADPALASARAIASELRSGVDSTSSRPLGSYAPLFTYLTAQCARHNVDVRLRTSVEHIAWRPGQITLATSAQSPGSGSVRARCAIVTVPVGVLQQRAAATPLSFEPPLPPEKRTALLGLEMGRVVRVVLAFRTPFWEQLDAGRYRDAAFFRCERGPFGAFWTQVPQRSRTIVAWCGGPRAAAMDAMPERERVELACDAFGSMLDAGDRARREFEEGATHDWSADGFACGAYSYVRTGAPEARTNLGTALGDTLFFAGEATSTDGQAGTVSGAFGTGVRAAREVAHALETIGTP